MANKASSSGGALPFFLGLIAMLIVGWVLFPKALFSAQKQPIRFSHKVHNEQGMACEDCHSFNKDGSYNGYPKNEKCGECHADVLGSDPDEKKYVEEFLKKEKEVPWLTYQQQPDNVFFSHAAHSKKQKCVSCHPDMANNDAPPVAYQNKLTGYMQLDLKMLNDTGTMKMYRCERCHAENGQSNACFVCHR